MNVLLISQCSKRALVETRRILDQFAERRGERTWQTPITQVGLDTVRKMLRKTARKNTAVACHWIRGRDHTELAWIVGDAKRFNAQGAVPTNTTERDILRSEHENDWVSAEDIKLLAILSSLFHDFGKASRAFQKKLESRKPIADAYRHEWVSLRLFEAFVGEDDDEGWLRRLERCDEKDTQVCLKRLVRDDQPGAISPFQKGHLPPLAQAIGWLVVTHHRLPVSDQYNASLLRRVEGLVAAPADWHGAQKEATKKDKARCWEFPKGLPFSSSDWRRRVQRQARLILQRPGIVKCGERLLHDPYVMHLSRLALMLADHHYSSEDPNPRYGDSAFPLYANTDRDTRQFKQRLDEHLGGVASHARRVVLALPRLERELPRLARHKAFKQRTAHERFRWQNKAFDLAISVREESNHRGFFGINMASTGCGKTIANGRILYGLADPLKGARFTIALGLRTLTLQTGEAYRERLRLGSEDLAVLVGGGAVRELFEAGKKNERLSGSGSESADALVTEESSVHFEGSLADSPLSKWLKKNSDANKLLQAPILTCTIDHLVPATESLRGGRQIAPMLRLMTSDLVLDEPDDFDVDDLPALSRLVHWAGLLGSRVLLSSATLPPALVQGLFQAYREGRRSFQANRGVPGLPLSIPCAWFDESRCQKETVDGVESFLSAHSSFVKKRLISLRKDQPRRKVELTAVSSPGKGREGAIAAIAERLPAWIETMHSANHVVQPDTGVRVSFGLVRMANIAPLISVARALHHQSFELNAHVHLCVYHSKHPLLVRSAIESMLDRTLRRSDAEEAVFSEPIVLQALHGRPERDQIFVVLASPVAEVGRDHDYDWAIVEPSSMRSIIQLAGRIRRHRRNPPSGVNLLLLKKNIKGLEGKTPAFCRPGFEGALALSSHDLGDLLTDEQLTPLDAAPRIRERDPLRPSDNLVDLEHRALRNLMLGEDAGVTAYNVPDWWRPAAYLSGILQKAQRFRKSEPESFFALLPDEDDPNEFVFHEYLDDWIPSNKRLKPEASLTCPQISPWGPSDYCAELQALAERLEMDPLRCAKRYGTISMKPCDQGWLYSPSLGFSDVG